MTELHPVHANQKAYAKLQASMPTANRYIKKHYDNEPSGVQYSSLQSKPAKGEILSDTELSCTRIALAMDRTIWETREHVKPFNVFSKSINQELSRIDQEAKKVTMETVIEPVSVASKEQRSEIDHSGEMRVQAQYRQQAYNSIEDLEVYKQTYSQDDFKRKQLLEHQNAFRLAEVNKLPLICVMATREEKPYPELLEFGIEPSEHERLIALSKQRIEGFRSGMEAILEYRREVLKSDDFEALQASLEAEEQFIESLTTKKESSVPPPPPPHHKKA